MHRSDNTSLKKEVWKEIRRNKVTEILKVGREETKEVLSVLSQVCGMEIKCFQFSNIQQREIPVMIRAV